MAVVDKRDTVPIPQPAGYPFLGNITAVESEVPINSFINLGRQYGEIYSLTTFGHRSVFVNNVALMNEICDEKRFTKVIALSLNALRAGIHDGLFTARHREHNWEIAHRVLVPAFGPLNLKAMFDDMKDVASQLVLKWARYGNDYKIAATSDFTRLTLDTLALCAMDFRFNSFYKDELHPFVAAMTTFLKQGGERASRPPFMSAFYRSDDADFFGSIDYLRNLGADIVRHRRENPCDKRDLLNAMIKGKDPKTGEQLSEGTIIDNMITFLIAGHETTSGLLSFLWYFMLKNPEAYRKAQQEVDTVIGNRAIQFEDLGKLSYITAMLRETLRLQPTAPAYTIGTKSENGELLGGKYYVAHGEPILAILHNIHRDPAVYGTDAEEWKPERMLDENFNKLPPGAWKPFGNGSRACIGRPFAWQESLLVVATMLQYFNFTLDDPSYDLQIKSALTIKPKDLNIHARLRPRWTATAVEQNLTGVVSMPDSTHAESTKLTESAKSGMPFTILYGSNSGTCEAFASTLAADAAAHGFNAVKIDTLDAVAREDSPPDTPTVIITASYEGQPTDNAAHFFDWLSNLREDQKLSTNHAVFGAGHSDWKATFHKIPIEIDRMLALHGSKRICERGGADASKGDMMSEFQAWEDDVLWPAMKKQFGGEGSTNGPDASSQTANLSIETSSRRASHLRADVSEARVLATKVLTAPGVPEKRHIEMQLPSNMTYRAGDYLAILPLNPEETVHRVALRFGLPWDSMLTLTSKTGTVLPTNVPISAHTIFSAYLELSQPATKRNLSMLIEAANDKKTKAALETLASQENFTKEITEKRVSLLDLLERFPAIPLPLSAFVASLITMRVRQYSISSSPLASPNTCTLTYAVLNTPHVCDPERRYIGVASHYLSFLQPGDVIHVAVKQSHASFHLPSDGEKTPVLMAAAGTGLAPFRGFIQERAAQIAAGRSLAPAHLYYGCHHPEKDAMYTEELKRWSALGAVEVHYAFSNAPELSGGHKHIDDALRADKQMLSRMWLDDDARMFVCGSRGVGDGIKKIAIEIWTENMKAAGREYGEKDAEKWFEEMRGERFATDVFD